MELKVDDKLICRESCIMNKSREIATVIGKSYIISKLDKDGFFIYDEQDNHHHFSYKNYEKWFDTLKIIRKKKLEKLRSFRFIE